MSEYLPDHYTARSWFSGFNGSAGTLAVTSEKAALWADGRYFIQAEHQLEGSGIVLMKMGEPGVPTVEKWLADELPEEGSMGIDGVITSTSFAEELKKAFDGKKISLKNMDLISPVWTEDRPAAPATKAWILDASYAGKTPSEKLADVRENLKKRVPTLILPPDWKAPHGF
ncbi:MAG: aminopeptidase P family N-terminal domain-containing protein [Blautia sp.]